VRCTREGALTCWCTCRYEFFILVSATLAVVLQEPSLTLGPLFEICFWKGSKTVIDAVGFNLGKMIQTFVLGLLVVYLWSIMGIWMLSDIHEDEHCNNMLQCFFAYFYISCCRTNPTQLARPSRADLQRNFWMKHPERLSIHRTDNAELSAACEARVSWTRLWIRRLLTTLSISQSPR
jgi:hypothetical protein